MELLFITLADFAQVVQGKMYTMGGGWDTLNAPPQAAGGHVVHVALSLSVGWAEMTREHELALELQQSGQRVGQIGSAKFVVPKPPGDVFLHRRTFMMSMPVQVPLAAGEYKIKLLVDGKEIGAVGYSVVAPMSAFVPPGTPKARIGSS